MDIADGLIPVKQQDFRTVYIDKLGIGMWYRILRDIPFEIAQCILGFLFFFRFAKQFNQPYDQ